MRCEERDERLVERGRRAGANAARRLRLEPRLDWWLEVVHEPPADETRPRGAAPLTSVGARSGGERLHRIEVHPVCGSEVVEAFRDTPRAGCRAPRASFLRQARNECARVAFHRPQGVVQCLKVRRQRSAHILYSATMVSALTG